MILTAHQPVYLPWLGLFHKIALADQFVSFNQVQYQVRDWNNRNKIKTNAGDIWLSVPVKHKGHLDLKYEDILIDNEQPWQRKHWKSLFLNYKAAPHFKKYADYFEDCYRREWKTLLELNESMLLWFLKTLGIPVAIQSARSMDLEGEKSDLVLDMCVKLGAATYIFGAQGRDYADKQSFAKAGVLPLFQQYRHPVYRQLHGEFRPFMSIVDLLFNCGEDSLEILMSGNLSKADLTSSPDWR